MTIKKYAIALLSLVVLTFSCSSDDDYVQPEPQGDYENGVLIINEGNFGQGNGSVSFVSGDFSRTENNIFANVNNKILGDVVQSIGFYNDLAYIVVNNSQKIEVVNRYTFHSVATIDSGLSNPRFITFTFNKGYVTNWGDGSDPSDDYVAVIDLNTNTVSGTISVEEGPEQIVSNGHSVYVAHAGGYSQNNIVSVIDPNSDKVTSTITVGDVPNSMALADQGSLYVLSGGKPSWLENETGGRLSLINTNSNTVISTLDFGATEHPSNLTYDGSLYYYMNGAVFKLAVGSSELPTTSEITDVNFNFITVNKGVLYGVDVGDYTSNGTLVTYDLTTHTKTHSVKVGLIPGGVYFND